ncbi:MAG: hypothetical protein WA634_07790 [Silvibacterium sp.]
MITLKKPCICALAFLASLSLSACRSAFVQTAIVNHTGGEVQLIEVDYPSASFGTQQIANSATYHYRFKILDSGNVKISYTGADNKVYSVTGPNLTQGQQGTLAIVLDGNGKVTWTPKLTPSN